MEIGRNIVEKPRNNCGKSVKTAPHFLVFSSPASCRVPEARLSAFVVLLERVRGPSQSEEDAEESGGRWRRRE
jgi:hypothetical protein